MSSGPHSAAPRVAILGGGPAGCGAAWKLRQTDKAQVTLFEQRTELGGNAGSFHFGDQWVDYGSHRLHHACDQEVLDDIRALLGDDLRRRERHGRIRLRGRWIRFPLRTLDLLLHLDPAFALGILGDALARALPSRAAPPAGSFAAELSERLGSTLCEGFYFPYARKIWGREPGELDAEQARRRVSASSFRALIGRLLRPPSTNTFFYPRRGFGQIAGAFAGAAGAAGADLRTGWVIRALRCPPMDSEPWSIEADVAGQPGSLQADHVWSTLPLTLTARLMQPAAPRAVLEAAASIEYRAMVLVYLQLDVDQFSPTDAHYFPETEVAMTRLSEPKNYFGDPVPRGTTVLCAELPCSPQDEIWSLDDAGLGERVAADLERAALPLPVRPRRVVSRRLRHAYPIYSAGYGVALRTIDDWLASLPRFLSYGRQGLFAHDNTHHALFMAYCAERCLAVSGSFDQAKWREYRKIFETHVVED